MTELLEEAFEQVKQLPETEQDAIAAVILEEIRSEQRWQTAFTQCQERLAALAKEALAEHRAGRTRELDPDLL